MQRYTALRQSVRFYAAGAKDADKSVFEKAKDKVGEGMEKVAQAFEKDGAIGKQFTTKGSVGGTAQEAGKGTDFDKHGDVGHQFTTKGKIGGNVQKAAEKVEHKGDKLQKEANKH